MNDHRTHAGAPALSTLAVPMILLNLILELQIGLSDEDKAVFYPAEKLWCVAEIKKHVHEEKRLVLENVRPDGRWEGWFSLSRGGMSVRRHPPVSPPPLNCFHFLACQLRWLVSRWSAYQPGPRN
jgi:hypothetical protein